MVRFLWLIFLFQISWGQQPDFSRWKGLGALAPLKDQKRNQEQMNKGKSSSSNTRAHQSRKLNSTSPLNPAKPSTMNGWTFKTENSSPPLSPGSQRGKSRQPSSLDKNSNKASSTSDSPQGPLNPAGLNSPSLVDHFSALFRAPAQEKIQDLRNQISDQDERSKRIALSIALGNLHWQNSSNSIYRNFSMNALIYRFQSRLWLTPGLSLDVAYLASHLADINSAGPSTSSVSPERRVSVKFEEQSLSIQYLRNFGSSAPESSSVMGLETSLAWNQWNLAVPATESTRPQLSTSGLGVGVGALWTGTRYLRARWSGQFFPQLSHRESFSDASLSSGYSPTGSAWTLKTGLGYRISPSHQMDLDFMSRSERYQFSQPQQTTTIQSQFWQVQAGFKWSH